MRLVHRIALCTLCVLASTVARAQVQTGSIAGVVTDSSNLVLPGATVSMSGEKLIGGVQTQTTDATGAYAFTKLPLGIYTVCQVPVAGWMQTGPKAAVGTACPGGTGWSLEVPASMPALWYGSIDFGNAGIAQ